jgi:hypothetical protein
VKGHYVEEVNNSSEGTQCMRIKRVKLGLNKADRNVLQLFLRHAGRQVTAEVAGENVHSARETQTNNTCFYAHEWS